MKKATLQIYLAMTAEENFAKLRLIRSARIGPVTYRQLLARFGSARAAIDALPEMARRGGAKGIKLADVARVEQEIAATHNMGATFLFVGDANYPALLSQMEDAPAVLIARGDISLFDKPSVAMVGARNASAAACRLARELSARLAEEGLAVISGLARGIDTACHMGAIHRATVAVIAGGIDNVYPPENRKLQEEIAERALLISEMPFGTEPRARHFPHRNRIIAGLARGTLVVEAAPKSGSLITARLAGEAGREVMAIPGSPLDPRSRGCNGLIRDGATLVQHVDDIIEAVGNWSGGPVSPMMFEARGDYVSYSEYSPAYENKPAVSRSTTTQADEPSAGQRRELGDLLSANYVSVDELVRQSQMPVEDVQLCLLELELAGRLERGAGAKVRLVG